MKHINLSSFKGSITDWSILNYVKGGLADEYADIANLSLYDEYNYYNFNNNQIAQKVMRYNLGSFSWEKDGYNNWLTPINSIPAGKTSLSCFCAKYPTTPYPENADYGCKLSLSNRIVIHDKDTITMTPEEFKEYVNGIDFDYILANIIYIDVSQTPDIELARIALTLSKNVSETIDEGTPIESKDIK